MENIFRGIDNLDTVATPDVLKFWSGSADKLLFLKKVPKQLRKPTECNVRRLCIRLTIKNSVFLILYVEKQ
jgi:hypothetical protein